MPAGGRILIVAAFGVVAGVVAGRVASVELAPLIGWDVAAAVYLVWIWAVVWPKDAEWTAQHARREDPTRTAADLLVLGAAVASLLAVGLTLVSVNPSRSLTLSLTVASVVLSWAVVHTLFALRYARMYYAGKDGGVDFKQDEPPTYVEFAYLAFTIGMTFQVSDTDLQAREFRRAALQHALLSYMFGTGLVATTVNLIVNLSTSGGHGG
jgi:uncharacterized membrane protein